MLSRIFAKTRQAPGQLPPRTTSHLLFGWNHGHSSPIPVMEELPTILTRIIGSAANGRTTKSRSPHLTAISQLRFGLLINRC